MDISTPLTHTKVLVPRRREELLSRPRLLRLVNEFLDSKLIIVAAPAGYGKTSLMVDFAHQTDMPVCWYSLDSLDQSPYRFVSHLIASISVRFPSFGMNSMAALRAMNQDELNLDSLVSIIVNDAYEHISEHFMVVLDDFHLVEKNQNIRYFINRFLQDIDENCHLVVISRTLLALPDLPLLVARSQVGGLSYEELTFNAEEFRELLKKNFDQELSEEQAEQLVTDTEGWITGLLLSTQVNSRVTEENKRITRVSGINVYEYLTQQVVNLQSEDVQIFLYFSSLLEEFDANLCRIVIGEALGSEKNWDQLMSQVLRQNLFVLPLSEPGEEKIWLRYHHLFQDYLQKQAFDKYPEESRLILLKFAEKLTEFEDWERAYQIYSRLKAEDAIIGLLLNSGPKMVSKGKFKTIGEWIAQLPENRVYRNPGLLSLKGTVEIIQGDTKNGLEELNDAIKMMGDHFDPKFYFPAILRRAVTNLLLGNYQDALVDVDWVLNTTNEKDLVLYRADAYHEKGMTLYYLGKLTDSLQCLENALAKYQEIRDNEAAAKVLMSVGLVAKASGDLTKAENAYQRALAYYQETGNIIWQTNLHNNLGVLHHLMGHYEKAADYLEKSIEYSKIGNYPRMEAYALASIGDLYRELDALPESSEANWQARIISHRTEDHFLNFYLDLVDVRINRMQGKLNEAEEALNDILKRVNENGSPQEKNLCLLEFGAISVEKNNFEVAKDELEKVFQYYLSEGYQIEAAQASLLLASGYIHQNQQEKAIFYFTQYLKLLSDNEYSHSRIVLGKEYKKFVWELHKIPQLQFYIDDLIASINNHENEIPQLRRKIRNKASAVPLAPPKIIIQGLGKIQVKVSDKILTNSDWQGNVSRDLFFYILMHKNGVSKDEIGEVFWPESSAADLKLRFKNAIYRLRRATGKDVIRYQDDLYTFNRFQDYEYDVESFMKEINFARDAKEVIDSIRHYEEAIKYYKGEFLPKTNESWAINEREYLSILYIDTLENLASLNLEVKAYENTILYCQMLINQDPCFENAHRLAMKAYFETGNRAAVIRQYEKCKEALAEELDAKPSEITQQLYVSLIR